MAADQGGGMRNRGPIARRDLQPSSITVDGVARTFVVAPAGENRPLVVVLHGGGGQARGTIGLTRLADKGAAAGFATAFPNGLHRSWSDGRTGARIANRRHDDVGFLLAMIDRLATDRIADPGAVFVCGISNGAFMSDHLARCAPDRVAGVGLVAGTSGTQARAVDPPARGPMPVMLFHGTADPVVPYAGGPILPNRRARVRGRHQGPVPPLMDDGGRGRCVGAEELAAEWAGANGAVGPPAVEILTPPPGELAVTRLSWTAPGGVPVVLHRIEGGGHTWPGGPQYLPTALIGPTAARLDASAILLDYFRAVLARRSG
jgi:polyhydroxybutyrate depolymerase